MDAKTKYINAKKYLEGKKLKKEEELRKRDPKINVSEDEDVKNLTVAAAALTKLEKYIKEGTVADFRNLTSKEQELQWMHMTRDDEEFCVCPVCFSGFPTDMFMMIPISYCPVCGQHLESEIYYFDDDEDQEVLSVEIDGVRHLVEEDGNTACRIDIPEFEEEEQNEVLDSVSAITDVEEITCLRCKRIMKKRIKNGDYTME